MLFVNKPYLLFWLLGIASISSGQIVCDGSAFFSFPNGSNTNMYRFNAISFQFEPFAINLPYINGIGFNPEDNNIYGFGNGGQMLRIDAGGQSTNLGTVPGLIPDGLWAGCFSPAGTYFLTGNSTKIYQIDVLGFSPVVVSEATKFYVNNTGIGNPSFGDIVVDPTTGIFYGYDDSLQKLAAIDPFTGAVNAFGIVQENIPVSGAMVADARGEIYAFVFNELYHVDKSTGAFTYLYDAPDNNGGIDACSCPYYVDLIKSISSPRACAGDTINYDFSFFNTSRNVVTGLTFSDSLPSPLIIIGVPDDLMGGSVLTNSGMGYNHISIVNMTLPEGASSFQVQAQIPTDFTSQMTLSNQASIVGFPSHLPPVVLSDDAQTIALDDPTKVEVFPLPDFELDILIPDLNCEGDTITIYAQSEESGAFQWSSEGIVLSEEDRLQLYQVTSEQTARYDLRYTDANGCQLDTFVNIDIIPVDRIDLGNDTLVCLTTPLRLSPGAFSEYSWQDGTSGSLLLATNYGSYSVTVTNANGCTDQDTILLSPGCPTQMYMPNAFSPNGDGVNDMLRAYALEVTEFSLRIFDRWGEEVFYSNSITKGWEGDFLGKAMGAGVFVYLLEASFLNGEKIKESGSVSLLR